MNYCTIFSECLYNYQTLVSGVLAILAAGITAIIIWWTAYLPIKHNKQEVEKQIGRKRHYVALVLSRNFQELSTRSRQAQGTVKVIKAANGKVTEKIRERVILKFDPIIDDWELMSLFPTEVLTAIVDLRKVINEHNFDMEGAGGAFGDDNFGRHIIDRLDSIKVKCNDLSGKLITFGKESE